MLSYLVRRSLRTRYAEIASAVHVTSEWLAFKSEKPERPRGFSQVISLEIPGYSFDHFEDDFEIRLSEGRSVKPIIEVIDASGNTFETEDGSRVGSHVGFHVIPNTELGFSLSDEPQNVTVRIRSEVAFECKSIRWATKRLK